MAATIVAALLALGVLAWVVASGRHVPVSPACATLLRERDSTVRMLLAADQRAGFARPGDGLPDSTEVRVRLAGLEWQVARECP